MRHTGKQTNTTTTEDVNFVCFVMRLLAPVTLTGHQGPHTKNKQILYNMETVKTALYVCTLQEMFDTQYNIFMSVLHLVKTM